MTAEISEEFGGALKQTFENKLEGRDYVPFTYAQRTLLSIVQKRYKSPSHQERAMTQYAPLADWLAKPKTIDELMQLKSDLYSLSCHLAQLHLFGDIEMMLSVGVDEKVWNDRRADWYKTLGWMFSLSDAFRIWPKENIEYIKSQKGKRILGAGVYGDLEGLPTNDIAYYPYREIAPLEQPSYTWFDDSSRLKIMSTEFQRKREKDYFIDNEWGKPTIKRLGLIIGDLRVGDHLAHGRFLEKAKYALGTRGALVVILPSNKTIQATTNKQESWPDEDRIYRLRSNRFVDYSLLIDMPKEYYSNPSEYWKMVWKVINPDFVFLGEENHPLEPLYREQSKSLGGILLVDDVPVTRRSADLLQIK